MYFELNCCFFFFKHKTAYEMRISDWSSDVCSSDLRFPMAEPITLAALELDAALGWPCALYRLAGHPVGWFAWLIDAAERHWNGPERHFGKIGRASCRERVCQYV